MALEWNDEFENEEELKKLTGVQLRELYRNAPEDKKAKIAKVAGQYLSESVEKLSAQTEENATVYDILATIKVVKEYNEKTTENKLSVNYTDVMKVYATKEALDENEDNDFFAVLRNMAVAEILEISQSQLNASKKEEITKEDREKLQALTSNKNKKIERVEQELKSQTEYSLEKEQGYYTADNAGALDDVSQDAKDQFLAFIAKNTGWEKASKESIEAADKKLNDNISQVYVYIEKDGQIVLNPMFAECQELVSSIKYEFPENTDEETQQKLTLAYNQQLMANALQRATQDVLKNPSLLGDENTKETIEANFGKLIADNFERSVIVAGLASSPNTTNGLTINADTGRVEYNNSDSTAKDIDEILKGERKISPMAVNLDTYQLGVETTRAEKILDMKKVSKDKVPFFTKVKAIGKAAYDNIIKKGGWKKVAVNMAMFGGAAAAMASGAAAVVAAGAVVYAGWTAANSWVAPVWDKLSAEMRSQKITGFKNKLSYRLKNWKRAKDEKYAEPDFKKRAALRTIEGVTVGGVSAALGLGGAGSWLKTLGRQGAMIVGKGGSLTRSWFKRKTAAEKLAETYSVANYKTLQTAEGYLKQDKIALGAVIGGALLSDMIKLNAEGSLDTSGLDEKLNDLTEKVRGTATPSEVELENVAPEAEVAPQPEAEVAPQPEAEVAPQPEAEVAPQPEAEVASEAEPAKAIDVKDLDRDHQKMFLNSHKKWENTDINEYIGQFEKQGYHVYGDFQGASENRVQWFYDCIQRGMVESCPEGMSPVEYVDKLTRLIQLAPVEQKKGIELMIRDLMCDDYHPSEGDKQIIFDALNTIRYEKGSMQCIMEDANGNFCVKDMPRFGNYFGSEKVAEIDMGNGEKMLLPIRNANVTVAIDAEVNCDEGVGKVSGVYTSNEVDCGCDNTPKLIDEVSNGEDMSVMTETDVPLPKDKVNVDMQDPEAQGTAIKSDKNSYFDVDPSSVNGTVEEYKDGVAIVWDKDGVKVTEEGYEGVEYFGPKGVEVHLQEATDVTHVIEKLPDVPTSIVNGDDGSISYLYEFEEGKKIQVVIDPQKEDGISRIGHFYVDGKEVIVDGKSAEALMEKMSAKTNTEFTSTDGLEQNTPDNIKEALQQKRNEYRSGLAEHTDKPIAPKEGAEFTQPRVSIQKSSLTPEQKSQIMAEGTELKYEGIRDGKVIVLVNGEDGSAPFRAAITAPTHIEYDSHVEPEVEIAENGQYFISMTTSDNKQMLISIANGKAKTTLDGQSVFLDSKSSADTQKLVKEALLQENVNMNIKLHTPFTEKLLKVVEQPQNKPMTQIMNAQTTRN